MTAAEVIHSTEPELASDPCQDVEPGGAQLGAACRPNLPAASGAADVALQEQRARHEGDEVDVDETGVGAIVNNTGLDGDAATG